MIHPILETLSLSDEQRPAVLARDADVVVTAGAGAGKTRTLVARYLALAAEGVPLRHIVAVTFTQKAAREMRNRVRDLMRRYLEENGHDEAERQMWAGQYVALDAARIGTIHNLCAELLRAHPAEASVDPAFGVLEEGAATILRRQAVNTALARAAEDPQLVGLFALLGEQTLWDTLNTLLAKRLDAAGVFLPLTADAIGLHWRDTLTRRQQETFARLQGHPHWQAHLATLRQNVALKEVDFQEQQRRAVLAAIGMATAAQWPEKIRLMSLISHIKLTAGSSKAWPGGKEQLDEVKAALRGLRERWQAEETMLTLSLTPLDESVAAALPALHALLDLACAYYHALKQERNSLDFDDLEAGGLSLLRGHPAARARWQTTVAAVLVDEFQDTNGRQRELLRLLCDKPGKLFIVGDAKQSIYRFRGADVAVFRRERAAVAQQNGVLCALATSYRAHRPLIEALNELLRPVLGGGDANLPEWVEPFAPLNHHRQTAAGDLLPPYVEVHLTAGSKTEGALRRAAEALVRRLSRLLAESNGLFTPGDVVVLCRSSISFAPYEDALDAAGIPFVTVAGRGFYDRPEVRDLLNALKAINDPTDDLALVGLLRSPACALSDAALYDLTRARQPGESLWQTLISNPQSSISSFDIPRAHRAISLINRLHRRAGRTSVADLLKAFLDETAYRAALILVGDRRAARNVAKLLANAHASGLVSVADFLEYIAGLRDSGTREGEARASGEGAVQIMSVHAAKGLEFPIVVLGDATYEGVARHELLLDVDLGILPPLKDEAGGRYAAYQMAWQTAEAQEAAEADRLLYVAATRAQERLIFNGCVTVKKDGRLGGLSGWLGRIAAITGLPQADCSHYRDDGNRQLALALPPGPAHVAAFLYEPQYQDEPRPLPNSIPR